MSTNTHCGRGPACGAPMGGCSCRCACPCATCRPRGALKEILADPAKRRELFARCIQSLQNMENPAGVETTLAQAYAAYDAVQLERPRAVVNVRRRPVLAGWCVSLSCGHEVNVVTKNKPTRKIMRCLQCEECQTPVRR